MVALPPLKDLYLRRRAAFWMFRPHRQEPPGDPPAPTPETLAGSTRGGGRGGLRNEPGVPVACLPPALGRRLLLQTTSDRGWFAVGFRKASLPMTTTIRLCAESW
jgi:hypothetical protein